MLALAGCASIVAPAMASAYCYEPNPPYCAGRYDAFDDEWEFDKCRREVEAYRSEVRTYLFCLQGQRDLAVQKVNDAVEGFNRRARQ
jgi:hypothetical protein